MALNEAPNYGTRLVGYRTSYDVIADLTKEIKRIKDESVHGN